MVHLICTDIIVLGIALRSEFNIHDMRIFSNRTFDRETKTLLLCRRPHAIVPAKFPIRFCCEMDGELSKLNTQKRNAFSIIPLRQCNCAATFTKPNDYQIVDNISGIILGWNHFTCFTLMKFNAFVARSRLRSSTRLSMASDSFTFLFVLQPALRVTAQSFSTMLYTRLNIIYLYI